VAIGALAAMIAVVFAGGLIWQGSSLEDGLTFFSWLLQAGATGILVVYALVALAGALHSRRHGSTSVVDLWIAPALALVVVVAAGGRRGRRQTGRRPRQDALSAGRTGPGS